MHGAIAILTALSLSLAGDDPENSHLAMSPAIACLKVNGYGDFIPLEDAALTRDDKLQVYYEPTGFEYETVGKEYRVHLVQDARIRRRGEKKVLQGKDRLLSYDARSKEPPLNIFLLNSIALKALSPGEYDLDIILHDEIGKGPPVSQTLKFRVKAAEKPEEKSKSRFPMEEEDLTADDADQHRY